MNKDIHVHEILKAYIKKNKVNVSRLAREAGVKYNVLYNVLRDRTALKADDFIKICNALNMTGDDLLTYPLDDKKEAQI